MKRFAFGFVLLLGITFCSSMTEKQLNNAARLIRNACIPKTKTTEEQVMKMHAGNWSDESSQIKCFINCALSMMKVCKKNGEFDLNEALKQVPQLPESRQEPTTVSMQECASVKANSDKCDSSWRFAKCLYFSNPENYFLP